VKRDVWRDRQIVEVIVCQVCRVVKGFYLQGKIWNPTASCACGIKNVHRIKINDGYIVIEKEYP